MKAYGKENRQWWDKATPIHVKSKLYDLKSFLKGKTSLQNIELKELTSVKGKTLLHLMCHFGLDSLSWARKGAMVTGVDFSEKAIETAKKIGKEVNIPAEFICSDIYKLKTAIRKKYDIVFMSYGVLLWLPDLRKLAKLVRRFLKKNGVFYIVELHPFTNILTYDFKINYNYFDKGPYIDDSSGTYANWNEKINGETYQWDYKISDILNSLIMEGLKIDYVHEFPFTMYEQFPGVMKKNRKGQFVFKDKNIQIPLLFSLKARK